MKEFIVLFIFLISTIAFAQADSNVVEAETINVDGYLQQEASPDDGELTQIQAEIKRQKEEIQLNKAKAKGFQELSKSVEKLSETTEEYIEEKKAAQKEIADYNMKVKCLQSDSPGAECDRFIRRRQ